MNSLLQSFRHVVIILIACPLLFSQRVFGQSPSPAQPSQAIASSPYAEKPENNVETSISVGSMAQLSTARIQATDTSLTTESLAPSAGIFATFRQTFKPWLGYSVNLGYTHPTYRYTVSAPASSTGITSMTLTPAHMYEISVSYIAQKHLTSRLGAFGEVGGGTLVFAANNTGGNLPNKSNVFRPEAIAGFGIDYRLTAGLGLRAQYRGLFVRYPYPDDVFATRLNTFISEPTLSLTYTFGRHTPRAGRPSSR